MLQFLNPALLFGAALFAVPLIIHLLNRQRFKRRQWAAMEFLLAAYKKQRRRLRRENLLLLLLRCLIPIALAFAIARPLLREAAAFAGLGGSAHHVFVFDHTYSNGLELPGGGTPFERSKQRAIAILDGLAGGGGHKVSIVVAGVRTAVPIREDLNLQRCKQVVATMPAPVDGGATLTSALEHVADLVEASPDADQRVYLFTDLQVRAFGADPFATEPDAPPAEGAAPQPPTRAMFEDSARDAIGRIAAAAQLTTLDSRSAGGEGGREDNAAVIDLHLGISHAIAKVATPVIARVANRTATARSVQVTLEIDGDRPVRRSVQIDAGGEQDVEFRIPLNELGQRRLKCTIDADALAADDARYLVVDVRDRLRVLLVEGRDGETDEALLETTLPRNVLDPTSGEGPPELTVFQPKVVDAHALMLGRERPADYDLIVLCNVSVLHRDSAAAMRAAVANGAGLLVMLGDQADLASFNLGLHGGGEGPMPMRLVEARGYAPGADHYYGATVTAPDHPVFADFDQDVYFEILQNLPVYRFVACDAVADSAGSAPPPDPSPAGGAGSEDGGGPVRTATVLARVRDSELTPLLVASTYGRGKALFSTTAISGRPDRWNRLDELVVFMPLLHAACRWLTSPVSDPHNVMVGGSLLGTFEHDPVSPKVELPERFGDRLRSLGSARRVDERRFALPPFGTTDYAGFYRIYDEPQAGESRELWFAVNPDAAEGELTYFSHELARQRLGLQSIVTELPAESGAAVEAGLSELGPLLVALALMFVLGESALARFVSRRRS